MFSAGPASRPCAYPTGATRTTTPRVEALGLGRALSPDAAPAEIGSAVMDVLGDKALCGASRSFASAVPRLGELAHAADLIEQAV